MTVQGQQQISAQQAARLIFHTEKPDHRQVGEVCAWIRGGALRGSRQGGWKTTREAVAEFLAKQTVRKATSNPERSASNAKTRKPDESAASRPSRYKAGSRSEREMQGVYKDLLSEYFLSVFSRGRSRRQSDQFQRNVLVIRGVLLAVLLALGGWILLTAGGTISPERRIVEAWLAENAEDAAVLHWAPPAPRSGGSAIRVQYRYRARSNKLVQTDRVFVIQGGKVAAVLMPDEQPEED